MCERCRRGRSVLLGHSCYQKVAGHCCEWMGLKILNEVKVFEMSDVCNVPNKYLIELIVWHVKQKFLPTVYPQPT